ncbi:MAG: transporter [Lacunisphaera sp.]|nr:transporter [Lacunisphaera sp.]MDB6165991.1 transporter [Lacunisphaera sp.]
MKFSGSHLKRYRQIVALLWKYGRSDIAQQMSAEEGFGEDEDKPILDEAGQPVPEAIALEAGGAAAAGDASPDKPQVAGDPSTGKKSGSSAASPQALADDLEAMGPSYVKLGQVLAGRPDLLPEDYRKGLARLQDNVKPFPYEQVEAIVEAELGVRISKAFSLFGTEPVAAASLGQVHRATLRDGRAVVVKVQRPDIRQQIAQDFEVLEEIAKFMDAHTEMGKRHRFLVILAEFRQAIQQELNYEREAHNLIALGKNLEEFKRIQVPQPIPNYYTRSVLTMEEISGRKITELGPLGQMELKEVPLAEELFKAYLKQVLVDGLFHADPHPGNVFVTNDGRIALIDLGMVGHTAPVMQESLLKILLAISEGNGEAAAETAIRMSEKLEDCNATEFRRRITQLVALRRDQGLEELNVGRSLLEVSGIAQDNGFIVPSELVLLGKTMLQLDEVGRILDPNFDTNSSIRRNVADLMSRRMRQNLTQGNIYSSLLEMKEFVTGLPARLNKIMDMVTNSELEVTVKSPDTKVVLDGMQKIANRITTGIVLAGLVVGASLLMRVQTAFQLFGYPGLAILCFIAAAAGGFWLVISVFVQDYKSRKKLKH